MSLRVRSLTQSADGNRSLVVSSPVRWKHNKQSTRSGQTRGIVALRLKQNPSPATGHEEKDAA